MEFDHIGLKESDLEKIIKEKRIYYDHEVESKLRELASNKKVINAFLHSRGYHNTFLNCLFMLCPFNKSITLNLILRFNIFDNDVGTEFSIPHATIFSK